ncbi:MAG TPA: hypothetical protein VHC22_18720 [Pirellulales bacterium]|nr:hypothetical protein [Pirellulales bacterium]
MSAALTTFVAMYFAAIRWIVVQYQTQAPYKLPWEGLISVAFVCTLLAVVSCKAVFYLTEALLWFAVWLVR